MLEGGTFCHQFSSEWYLDPKPAEAGVQLWRQLSALEEEKRSKQNAEASAGMFSYCRAHVILSVLSVFSLARNILK